MRRAPLVLAALLGLAAVFPPAATGAQQSRGYWGTQFRYWDFSDGNDLRDPLIYWVGRPWHTQLELWDFERGDDQFRLELGFHPRDARRSVYNLQYRTELKQDSPEHSQHRFWVGTDQVMNDHTVFRAEAGAIASEASAPAWVTTYGADYYWGSWNFLSASAIRDSREDDLWTFPVRLRLANEANDWFQVTVAPASHRTLGWAVDVKKSWLRLGVERNSRFDFTNRDNLIFTAGVERELPAAR